MTGCVSLQEYIFEYEVQLATVSYFQSLIPPFLEINFPTCIFEWDCHLGFLVFPYFCAFTRHLVLSREPR